MSHPETEERLNNACDPRNGQHVKGIWPKLKFTVCNPYFSEGTWTYI